MVLHTVERWTMFRQTAQASHLTGSCEWTLQSWTATVIQCSSLAMMLRMLFVRRVCRWDFLLSTQRETVSVLSGHRPMMQITMRSVSLMQEVITTARQLCHIQLLTMKWRDYIPTGLTHLQWGLFRQMVQRVCSAVRQPRRHFRTVLISI